MIDIGKFYAGKEVLVTGGRGYLGSCISAALIKCGAKVTIIDVSQTKWVPAAEGNVARHVRADITDVRSFKDELAVCDMIFHLAAQEYKRDGYSMIADYLVNAKAIADIMNACVEAECLPTIVFSSSSNIFGIQQMMPVDENSPDNPPSLWSAHKLLAEKYISFYSAKYKFRTSILRLPNIFGPTPRLDVFCRSSLNTLILNAISKGLIILYDNATCLRDYLGSEDVATALLMGGALASAWPKTNTFVLGSGTAYTYASLATVVAKIVAERTGRVVQIKYESGKYGEPLDQRDFVANPRAFGELTGWSPCKSTEDVVRETVEFVISRKIGK